MKFPKLPFRMLRSQFIGLAIIGILLLLGQGLFYWVKKQTKHDPILVKIEGNLTPENVVLSKFNPNDLSAEDWGKLGFTEKQIKTILKYKEIVGGSFSSKEQLAKCYAISSEKFEMLKPYIMLPEKENKVNHYQNFEKKKLNIKGKFNPDDFSAKDWENLGFTERQAEAILKYKNYLGGSFMSKEKFKECFIISAENYRQLSPYLILPETTPLSLKKDFSEKKKIQYAVFDPNDLDLQDWQKLGFSEKQAQVILNYKNRNLKGRFRTLEDVQRCFVISEEKFSELKPWIKIQFREEKVEKTENISVFKTDFSKIDLNTITFKQLVEFGFIEKAAGSFLGYRKLLGGFVTKQQILETYNIDKELTLKLLSICFLETSKIPKYSLKDAPEDFLKRHPYFKKYADKIIFYRVSFTEDKAVFDKIKASPEEISKMKLYLK